MTGSALFFVMVGVGVATSALMKLVEWLDTPREAHRSRRAAQAESAIDFPRAELALDRALYAA